MILEQDHIHTSLLSVILRIPLIVFIIFWLSSREVMPWFTPFLGLAVIYVVAPLFYPDTITQKDDRLLVCSAILLIISMLVFFDLLYEQDDLFNAGFWGTLYGIVSASSCYFKKSALQIDKHQLDESYDKDV